MNNTGEEKKSEEIEYITEKHETPEKTEKKEEAPREPAVVEAVKEGHKPESEEGRNLKSKLKKRDAEIKQLKKEKEEFRDQFLRKLAEMENLKKRLEREKSRLPPVRLERAPAGVPRGPGQLRKGPERRGTGSGREDLP